MRGFTKFIFAILILQSPLCGGEMTYQEVMDYLYNKSYEDPLMSSGAPVNVSLGMHVINLHSLSEDSMELEMDVYLRAYWKDNIFLLPPNSGWENGFDVSNFGRFWTPDIFSPNSREVKIHETLAPDIMGRAFPDGRIMGSVKLTIITRCNMDLSAFPFDTQTCEITFESYKLTKESMTLSWHEKGVTVSASSQPVAFHIVKEPELIKRITDTSSGDYESLVMKLQFKRIATHYILFIYLPSSLVVFLGGLLFWLPMGALAERTSFSAFLFLTMVLLSASSQYATPQVGYVKAIDAWCGTCTLFLFAAITEVLILHLLRVHQQQQHAESFQEMKEEPEGTHDAAHDTSFLASKLVIFRNPRVVYWIDMVLRALYPAVFILFVIVYASVYHT